jgi:hypothetical protein
MKLQEVNFGGCGLPHEIVGALKTFCFHSFIIELVQQGRLGGTGSIR